MKRSLNIGLSIFFLITVLLSACSAPTTQAPVATPLIEATKSSEPTTEPTKAPTATDLPVSAAEGLALPEVDPASVSGNIVLAGSSTVYPLAESMAIRFKDEGFTQNLGEITIDSIGSGAGFERFCKTGETDIATASRKIKDAEVENCKAIGRAPIAFRVGTDAISIVVNKDNSFLTDVTLEELAKIFSQDAVKWSDVRPDWPAEDILRFVPGTDSGTYDYFVESVMAPAYPVDGKANIDAGAAAFLAAANLQQSEDDNVLVQGVLGSPYAIGFFGFAYYQENADQLKVLSLNGIAPTAETAESNTYPLSRPLFIYSDAKIMQEKPQVAAFINFFLTFVNDQIIDVGYFPASVAALNEAKTAWLTALDQ